MQPAKDILKYYVVHIICILCNSCLYKPHLFLRSLYRQSNFYVTDPWTVFHLIQRCEGEQDYFWQWKLFFLFFFMIYEPNVPCTDCSRILWCFFFFFIIFSNNICVYYKCTCWIYMKLLNCIICTTLGSCFFGVLGLFFFRDMIFDIVLFLYSFLFSFVDIADTFFWFWGILTKQNILVSYCCRSIFIYLQVNGYCVGPLPECCLAAHMADFTSDLQFFLSWGSAVESLYSLRSFSVSSLKDIIGRSTLCLPLLHTRLLIYYGNGFPI